MTSMTAPPPGSRIRTTPSGFELSILNSLTLTMSMSGFQSSLKLYYQQMSRKELN